MIVPRPHTKKRTFALNELLRRNSLCSNQRTGLVQQLKVAVGDPRFVKLLAEAEAVKFHFLAMRTNFVVSPVAMRRTSRAHFSSAARLSDR